MLCHTLFFLLCQVSVIQYGVDAKFEFKLNQYKTKEEVIAAASAITQMYGQSTNTFHAIQYARLVSLEYWILCICIYAYIYECVCVVWLFINLLFDYLPCLF